jgi:hypothetical protein
LAISEHEERSLEGSEKEKRLSGGLYRASGAELVRERQRCRSLLQAFNTQPDEEQRLAVLRDLLGRPGRWGSPDRLRGGSDAAGRAGRHAAGGRLKLIYSD